MTYPRKELIIACHYLLRLIKQHAQLSTEQINVFKRTFYEILLKRFLGHWFPATPHRGSAYRCLQTKLWKDPVLRIIAERSRLPLHRYLPAIFTMWIDPGEVAICFGDEGTWCSLYKHDTDMDTEESFTEDYDLISSLIPNEDFSNLSENIQTLSLNTKSHSSNQLIETPIQTIDDCNYLRSNDWNIQQNNFWLQ